MIVFTAFTDAGALQIVFEWFFGKECFWIQTAGVSAPHKMQLPEKREYIPKSFGSDPGMFHTMKFHIHPERDRVDYLVDETLINTLVLEKKITNVNAASFTLECPASKAGVSIRFDDLIARRLAPRAKPETGEKKFIAE